MGLEGSRRRFPVLALWLAAPVAFAGEQIITPTPASLPVPPGQAVAFAVGYQTADPCTGTLTGLGLRLHWDSSKLTLTGLSEVLPTALVAQGPVEADTGDLDGDPATDRRVLLAWADIDAAWPGGGCARTDLFTAHFQTLAALTGSSAVHFSASSTAAGYDLRAVPVVVALDTDGDGIAEGSDNRPAHYNPGQEDADNDGIGDLCDSSLVTANAGGAGSISPSTPQTVTHGSRVSFSVTPNPGHRIAAVTGCGGTLAGNSYITGPITANCSVEARFGPQGADVGNDALIGFPGLGTWRWLNNRTWAQLHGQLARVAASADLDANGQPDLVVSFGPGLGTWSWLNNATWQQLHPLAVSGIGVADLDGNGRDDLLLAFPGLGIWRWLNNATWQQLHPQTVSAIGVADLDGNGQDDLVLAFPALGTWRWLNNTTWQRLHPLAVSAIGVGDLDSNGQADLLLAFPGPLGTWRWMNNATWQQLHPTPASLLQVGDIDGVAP